jgi:hypothetical protein
MNSIRPCILSLLLLPTLLLAQAPTPSTPAPGQTQQPATTTRPIWRVTLPAGTYEILVGAIIGVSSHEYVLDGAQRVTEVNVDTTGQFAVRFYFVEPVVTSGPGGLGAATLGKVQSILTESAERGVGDAWRKVVKNYPSTTHSKTIEYRLADRDGLNKVFSSASKCLRTGRGDELAITE